MRTNKLVRDIRGELKFHARKKNVIGAKQFFREEVWVYGVPTPAVKRIARNYAKRFNSDGDIGTAFSVAEKLLGSTNLEEGVVAIYMIRSFSKHFDHSLFPLFDQWVEYLTNWAHTDGLSVWIIGEVVRKSPEKISDLLRWTSSRNRWRRRAAAVALIPLARRGLHFTKILRLANRLMRDRDDMVQKGVGWLLKECSMSQPEEIVRYLLRWKGKTSSVTMRYACEKLPPSKRKLLINVRP